MWLLHHLCVLQYVAFFLLLVEGVRDTAGGEGVHEGGKVSKRSKPVDLDEGGHDNEDYYYEDVDERNNPTNEAPVVPPGFLSPSVREYLDLGKSIPGRAGTDYPVLGKMWKRDARHGTTVTLTVDKQHFCVQMSTLWQAHGESDETSSPHHQGIAREYFC
ncbi:uncharacterized protein LOC143265784 isoform X9 [Megachile rotundata]|uniref:uncharacterized protein LOC143265784 isoform X9 n=1 Tax=Megachile rotundata TaxID=143995 RepID=UPI003FD4CBC9